MAKSAVEFVSRGTKLLLVYRPNIRNPEHVRRDLAEGKSVIIKGTYHLAETDLFKGQIKQESNEWDGDDEEIRFVVAKALRNYFVFDSAILNVEVPVMIARDSKPTWKWFTAEERTSVIRRLAELRPTRIVIGGDLRDAIPIFEYEKLIGQFPSPHEMRLYVQSRLAVVFRELTDVKVDAGAKLERYVNKRVTAKSKDLIQPFRQSEISKYEFLHANLLAMLKNDVGMPERQWQAQILDIVRLLNPKYIAAFTSVKIKDSLTGRHRQLDIMLVDVNGNIDVIEIKKPFDARIVTTATYRDNHVPHRELVGTVMQVEKYMFHLKRWGAAGEQALTKHYKAELPPDLNLRIVNPCGLIIMGRDDDLTSEQRGDFEMYRRQHKNVFDVITYDDLLRRLGRVLEQLKSGR